MTEPFLSSAWYRVAPLKPRLRPHARIDTHSYGRETWYILHDAASGRVHRFTPAAHMVLSRMDGQTTLDAIWTDLAVHLEEEAPTQDEVLRLLSQLHANDLIQLKSIPQTAELLERHTKRRRADALAFVKNPMSGKIPLVDPDPLLRRLVAAGRGLHGWPLALLWLALVLPAALAAPLHWSELTENLSDRLLLGQNLLVMALVFPVVKIVHELGHGYAVRAFGGEAHEAGVMLLVFYPVPYIDASGALAFRSPSARALVGFAGIAVEFVLAALAFYVWLAAEAGVTRAVAFNVMLIAGVSTLLVNGNPLLRFDAYYVLSDLIQIPNLGTRANKFWGTLVDRYLFGAREKRSDATAREAVWFVLYAPAAYVYRLMVLFGISLFVATEFLAAGIALAAWSIVTGIVIPLWKSLHHVIAGASIRRHRRRAVLVTGGSVVALALVLGVIPLPMHTLAEGVIWLPEDAQVRAGTSGFAKRLLVPPGTQVAAGQPLLVLEEPTLAATIAAQRARTEEARLRFLAETVLDRVKSEITRRELEEEEARLARSLERQGKLLVKSPGSGTFAMPGAADLPDRFVREGQVIAYVTPPGGQQVRAVVTQDDIELVRHRLRGVRAKLAGRLDETFLASVTREVPAAQNELPSRVLATAGGGTLATDPTDKAGLRALQRLFQFDLALSPDPGESRFGGRVLLRFEHAPEPLGFQIARRVRQLFLARFHA